MTLRAVFTIAFASSLGAGCGPTEAEKKAEFAKLMEPYYQQKAAERALVSEQFKTVSDA